MKNFLKTLVIIFIMSIQYAQGNDVRKVHVDSLSANSEKRNSECIGVCQNYETPGSWAGDGQGFQCHDILRPGADRWFDCTCLCTKK